MNFVYATEIIIAAVLLVHGVHSFVTRNDNPSWSLVCSSDGTFGWTGEYGIVRGGFPTKESAQEALNKAKAANDQENSYKPCK